MPRSDHLLRRGSIFYYHRRVPLDLVGRVGKKQITFSLGTSDPKAARKKRDIEDLKYNTRFEELLASPLEAGLGSKQMSVASIMRLIQDYVESTDRSAKTKELTQAGQLPLEANEVRIELDVMRSMLRTDENPNVLQWISSEGAKVLGHSPSELSRENTLVPFLEIMRRALIELADRKLLRLDSDFSRPFVNDLFAPHKREAISFGDAANEYLLEVAESARANGTSQKWVDKQSSNIALLVEVLGAATSIRDVDYDQCKRVRSVLGAIPANRKKLYPKLDLEGAIRLGTAEQKPGLSVTTQDEYLGTLRGVLSLAAKKRLIAVNPAEGLSPLQRETVRAKDRRLPWTSDQLNGLFCGRYYRRCAEAEPSAPYRADPEGWRFWMPLLALFMGLRANEICQLGVDDVAQTQGGTWFVDVTNSEDDDGDTEKRLKTETSKRKVPVHPELLTMGFVEFVVERARGRQSGRSFPTLQPDKYGYFSKRPLRKFREQYIPEAVRLERRQSFHSLRHNFRDALRRAEATPDALQALGGWSQGKAVSDIYGDIENPDLQVRNISRVEFSELDLGFLHVLTSASGKNNEC